MYITFVNFAAAIKLLIDDNSNQNNEWECVEVTLCVHARKMSGVTYTRILTGMRFTG